MFSGSRKRVVLITGCTGVLGTRFCNVYADEFNIVGVARSEPKVKIENIDFLCGDVYFDAEKIVAEILSKYGRIDTLINGAVKYDLVPLEQKTVKNFEREVKIGLVAPLNLSNIILREYWGSEGEGENLKQKRSVINISSGSGLEIFPNIGQGTYSTIKAALNTLTKHMAAEYLKYGLYVNCLAPGSLKDVETLNSTIIKLESLSNDVGATAQIHQIVGDDITIY